VSDANSPEHGAPTDLEASGSSTPSGSDRSDGDARRGSEPGSVHVLLDPDSTLVVLAGDVDATLAPDLIDASSDVAEAGNPVRIDTRNVTFMDSTGVSFLARVAVGTGARPVLLDPPDHVQFLLDITAIGDLVDVEHTGSRPGAAASAATGTGTEGDGPQDDDAA
jgi:anti-sigma B factor antagonist